MILDSLVSVLVVLDVLVALLGAVEGSVVVEVVEVLVVAEVVVAAEVAVVAVVKSSSFLKRRRCPCIDVAGTFLYKIRHKRQIVIHRIKVKC